jgi:hypothetical protein
MKTAKRRSTQAKSIYLPTFLRQIDEGFEKTSWHGPNLKNSLRGVDRTMAAWRPDEGRHNIWEVVVHLAYWKHRINNRLDKNHTSTFPYKGTNWFKRTEAGTEEEWQADLKLLEEQHAALRETVTLLDIERLATRRLGSSSTYEHTLTGIPMHDIYHAGQISLLKRLQTSS